MFAIAGGKGGCGKTTTALGIARALAARGADPIVVDADVDMPDLHVLADVRAEPNAGDLAAGAHIACVCHTPPATPGVRVVPAGQSAETPPALERLREWAGPVLVDCPAGASEDATIPLRVADATILVSTAAPQSLADAQKTGRIGNRLGAPPVAALIRGSGAATAERPADVPTERIDDCTGEVLTDPRFQLACESLVTAISPSQTSDIKS